MCLAAGVWAALGGSAPATKPLTTLPTDPHSVVFNRDVRPLLADTCLKCHGFDANKRQAELRLDTKDGAMADLGNGKGAIVPGHPEESEAWRRVASNDPDEQMPPPESGMKLTAEQKELIKKWIEQGAEYQMHWSLIPPSDATLPEVKDQRWGKNGIDRFILARLEKEGMKPSPDTDKVTLIRRVSLDLTGLPPTPTEVDAFLADDSTDAYEKVVDRLLASPRYGERMALRWLDLARYADTNGYQIDTERAHWRWRDWVIDAFNKNQPFDQFTVEQIAGDLIPNATLDQKIASGFNRNHRINLEGGSIPEEFRVEYGVDRVETTATVWLGMTMGCARCHDHKYDPITQKEFYQFYGFFNNVPDNGLDGLNGNSVPMIPAPLKAEQAKLAELAREQGIADAIVKELEPKIVEAQTPWEKTLAAEREAEGLSKGITAKFEFEGSAKDASVDRRAGAFDTEPKFASGVYGQAADLDGKKVIDLDDVGNMERTDKFSMGAWINSPPECDGAIIGRMQDVNNAFHGYNLYNQKGLIHFQLIGRFPDNMLMMVSKGPITPNVWHHVFATYDGSSKAAGVKVYLDGKPLEMTAGNDTLSLSIRAAVPLYIGGRATTARLTGRVDDVRIYDRVLTPEEVAQLGGSRALARGAVQREAKDRTPDQLATLRAVFLEQAPPEMREPGQRAADLRKKQQDILNASPTVMVMAEKEKRDEAHILKRGRYDMPGEKVTAGVPKCLPALPEGAPVDRLALGKWLVDGKNPLTARVTVNRFWEMYFGRGIVKTTENLGAQAQWPSHPELLDWLAIQFVKSGWDVKAMQKLIVTSSTYRQQSKVTKEMLEKDPENMWLARGPRLRLPAEAIRDQALAISGLLVEKIGGPSVKTYQPAGLWEELTAGGGYTGQTYVQAKGADLYRRSMYSFWKRTIPPPGMAIFDAPAREVCTVNRSRTNTPTQALTLLNDPVYVEAARKLAERAIAEGGTKPAERITHAFRLAVARKPEASEMKILVEDFNFQLANFFADPEAATKLLAVGESAKNISFDQRELAAYTAVANLILNMDQTITRE